MGTGAVHDRVTAFGLAALAGCSAGEDPLPPGVCDAASAAYGAPVCRDEIPDPAAWEAVSAGPPLGQVLRSSKFLAPARDEARLPTIFVDVHTFPLHVDALMSGFPEVFPSLTPSQYLDLVLDPVGRELYAGGIEALRVEDDVVYAFTVLDDASVPSATVSEADVRAVHAALSARWGLAPLAFRPSTPNQQAASASWDLPFEVVGLASVPYEAYSTGVGFGTVRVFDPAGFAQAEAAAAYGFQDVLFLAEAPTDVERPISGALTGSRQAPLSHLSVRSASRGTPDCYSSDFDALAAAWEGVLVRFACTPEALEIAEADPADAAAFWEALRPDPVDVAPADTSEAPMWGLRELPVATAAERAAAKRRYGAKGANLGALYQQVDPDLQLAGFVIPMRAYEDFVTAQGWTVDLGDGARRHSFRDTLEAWHADPVFLSDARLRRDRLGALRAAMEASPVDPAWITAIGERIDAIWGDDAVTVRFRSSSNAEDGLWFNGAGLYESASGCLADDRDGDAVGPSRCDADRDDERTVATALTEVWASLWSTRAWEERAWYGIDPADVAMGVLVNTRTEDEQANAVVFTGDPRREDDRYRIDAQAGEVEVVSSDAGVIPESLAVTVEDGEVVAVERLSWSSELPFGVPVLTDAEVAEISAVMWEIDATFPLDEEAPPGVTVLWDTEWKVEADGRLVIKQIRPFPR